ncbi:hypothetical protein AJ79_06790 [Helicocarpus griseus UAMH5409]|uniref:Aldehyde dehydrogenase domain-containing protein n=1 Tax=Helicocarpus griseus UAMH5409 TaxID=1447875 RepID=A0A2B7X9N9_9EURO|nr:hypothetical protein AJ79_06790 [Helicocarpus griseus UAMH5409]
MWSKKVEPEQYFLDPTPHVPNSGLPIFVYRNVLSDTTPRNILTPSNPTAGSRAASGKHTNASLSHDCHECYGIVKGKSTYLLGVGPNGLEFDDKGNRLGMKLTVQKGDAFVLPAGVCNASIESEDDYEFIGLYPNGLLDESNYRFDMNYALKRLRENKGLAAKADALVISPLDPLYVAIILLLENGKVLSEAQDEIAYAASYVSWFADEAVQSYGDVIPSSYKNTTVLTLKEPVGVVGVITPWNFPAAPVTRKVAPELAAGCSVVIKPPSKTPFTVNALVNLALDAGIPANVIHVLPTKDRNAALELATHPKIRKLTFTGSTGVGKMLTQLALAR